MQHLQSYFFLYVRCFVIFATDITGFGLSGHVREIAAGSGVSVCINSANVPLLAGDRADQLWNLIDKDPIREQHDLELLRENYRPQDGRAV